MKLFEGKVSTILDISFDRNSEVSVAAQGEGRVSISGVQEKYGALVEMGKIRLAHEGEQGTHILKPAPNNPVIINQRYMPINEYVTMQIASRVYGIEVAPCGMCEDKDGNPVYITRRFDVLPDGKKLKQEDFASILGKNEIGNGMAYKYLGCYEDIAKAIKQYVPAWKIAMERFFKLLLFNYIYANGDAHLKNFSVMYDGNDYLLTPAYDLINTRLHIEDDDFALKEGLSRDMVKSDIWDRTGHPCRDDFKAFADKTGILPRRAEKIIEQFQVIPKQAEEIIGESALTEKLKRQYKSIVTERCKRFSRSDKQ